MEKLLLLFIIAFYARASYSQEIPIMQKKISKNEIHIDLSAAYQNKSPILQIGQFAEDIEFIPLETNDKCLLDDFLNNIIVTKNDIIVFDYNGCYRFNRKGKFLNKIGTKGNGPGEYINPSSIMVDTLNKWVYFSDYNTDGLIKYNYLGEYIEKLEIKGSGSKNTFYKPKEFILEGRFYQFAKEEERYSLLYYSESQKKIISKMRCDYDKEIPKLAMCTPISYSYKGEIYMKDFWCDTIYRMIDPYHLQSYAIFDRGEFELRTRSDKSLITGKEKDIDQKVIDILRISETDRYIFICSNRINAIYDKKSKKVYGGGELEEYERLGVEDDLYGSPGIRSDYFPNGIIGNELCTFRHAYEFIENRKNKHSINDFRYRTYQKMINNLNEDDNPVIMIVKIKR